MINNIYKSMFNKVIKQINECIIPNDEIEYPLCTICFVSKARIYADNDNCCTDCYYEDQNIKALYYQNLYG